MLELKQKLDIQSKNYITVLETIKSKHKQARLIGGVVRDSMLGLKSHDVDIATSMLPEEVTELFTSLGAKVIPTGIQFGTVTLLYKGEAFEITTLRKDLICNGRHAHVEYTDDFYLDALRRDFTINALSYCPFEEIIYDYFEGARDLKKGLVKFIGEPDERIKEDYLRILRFFRFFGRFGREIDQNSFDACIRYKGFLKNLSRERIKSELDLILKLPNFVDILLLMQEILPEILPVDERQCNGALTFPRADDSGIRNDITLLSNNLKYALLFKESSITEAELIALKFSRQEARNICRFLVLTTAKITEYFLKKLWLENDNFTEFVIFLNIINGENAENSKLFLQLSGRQKPKFPVNGHDLTSMGITGPDVKQALTSLQKQWIESDFQLTQTELLKLL